MTKVRNACRTFTLRNQDFILKAKKFNPFLHKNRALLIKRAGDGPFDSSVASRAFSDDDERYKRQYMFELLL